MSKLDDILDRAPYVYESMSICNSFDADEIKAARAELAALRRRAEDAEMIARAGLSGSPNDYRTSDGTWRFSIVDDCGNQTGLILRLQHDPATGLPILTDEARKAMQ